MTSDQLYAKYHRLVWCVARSMQRKCRLSEEDAEDIVNASWVKLLKQPPRNWKTPLYVRVVINCGARNELERILRYQKTLVYDDLPGRPHDRRHTADTAMSFDTVHPTQKSPEEQLIEQDLLDKYLATLSGTEKTIVDLMLGLSGEDPLGPLNTARKLGMKLPEVNRILETTYQRMRDLLSATNPTGVAMPHASIPGCPDCQDEGHKFVKPEFTSEIKQVEALNRRIIDIAKPYEDADVQLYVASGQCVFPEWRHPHNLVGYVTTDPQKPPCSGWQFCLGSGVDRVDLVELTIKKAFNCLRERLQVLQEAKR